MDHFPKIIHQIWLQGEDKIPNKFNNNIQEIKNHHKKWKYIFWDDLKIINLLRKKEEWIETFYKLEYLHMKVDFARYVIIYSFGGVYIDIDAKFIRPIDTLIEEFSNYDLIVSKQGTNLLESQIECRNNNCLNNGIIISKVNNVVIEKLIKSIIKNPICNFLSTKMTCIQEITGPKKFTKIIYENMDKVKILESEYLEPCLIDNCNITNNTYVIHKHNLSWIPDYLKRVGVLYVNNKIIFYFIIFFVSIIFIIFIILKFFNYI